MLNLQVPTVLSFAAALRQRGAQFAGLGLRGNDLNGATGTSFVTNNLYVIAN